MPDILRSTEYALFVDSLTDDRKGQAEELALLAAELAGVERDAWRVELDGADRLGHLYVTVETGEDGPPTEEVEARLELLRAAIAGELERIDVVRGIIRADPSSGASRGASRRWCWPFSRRAG